MHRPIVHCKLAKFLCTELVWTIVRDIDIRFIVRCEYLLQQAIDNALQRQVAMTFALDPSTAVFDYDEIDFAMQFKLSSSLPRARRK